MFLTLEKLFLNNQAKYVIILRSKIKITHSILKKEPIFIFSTYQFILLLHKV